MSELSYGDEKYHFVINEPKDKELAAFYQIIMDKNNVKRRLIFAAAAVAHHLGEGDFHSSHNIFNYNVIIQKGSKPERGPSWLPLIESTRKRTSNELFICHSKSAH